MTNESPPKGVVLMGMGNPLLDISANVDIDFLQQYDLQLDTAILADPTKHATLYSDLITKYPVQYIAGGATQNSMRVAQWMLSGSAGYPSQSVAFMGCIGNDDYGKQLAECASNDGVLVHYLINDTIPTGTCAALIVDGERSLVANLAAANHFNESHLTTDVAQSIVSTSQIYYSAGFFLTVSVPSFVQVATAFNATANKVVALNLSAPFIIEFFKDALATAMEHADYLFGNENEAETYARVNGLDPTDLPAVALALSALPKTNATTRGRVVVITQGSKSTIVAANGIVTEYTVPVLEKSLLVDTNGAGDAFVGGFLAQLVQNQPIATCVDAGHYAARTIIQVSGTSLDTPCTYSSAPK